MTDRKPLQQTIDTSRAVLCVAEMIWDNSREGIVADITNRDEATETYQDAVNYAGACLIEQAYEALALDVNPLMDDYVGEIHVAVCGWIEQATDDLNPERIAEQARDEARGQVGDFVLDGGAFRRIVKVEVIEGRVYYNFEDGGAIPDSLLTDEQICLESEVHIG